MSENSTKPDGDALPDETTTASGNIQIRAKFAGRCRICLQQISPGDVVNFNRSLTGSRVWHLGCSAGQKKSSDELLFGLRSRLQEAEAKKAAADPKDLLDTLQRADEALAIARKAQGIAEVANTSATKSASALDTVFKELTQVRQTYEKLLEAQGRRIIVTDASGAERADLGLQHFQFPTLLQAASARDPSGHRLNIWLSGPAGSGKTSAARSVAKALGLGFYFTGAIDTEYKLLGFVNAQGTVVSRPFREAWTNGGVFLKDEIDGSHPSALLALNAALANGICDFPDGAIERHPDFVCIAAANTWGQGATVEYVGRTRLDAASLDRFVQLDWPIDEDLEEATAPDQSWCRFVQRCRKALRDLGIAGHMITPRATYYGSALLAAGMPRDTVIKLSLQRGLPTDVWNRIANAANL